VHCVLSVDGAEEQMYDPRARKKNPPTPFTVQQCHFPGMPSRMELALHEAIS
jgi:hypothetical protein